MRKGGYDIISLADIHRVLLRPKNANLFFNVKHLSWSLGSLAALAACSGGGGGGGGGGSPAASEGVRVNQPTQPQTPAVQPQPQTPSPQPPVVQPPPTPTFPDAVDTAFATSPDTSGYLFNFAESPATVNDFANLQAGRFYAYQGDQLFTSDGGFTTTAAQAASDSTSGNGGTGSQASDFFYGNSNANNFNGASGNDVLIGRGGGDTLTGGAGNDILWGGADTDIVRGEGGDDIILIIGSNPGAYTYEDADLMIEASQLVSRNTDLDLTAVLGLTTAMVNNVATSEAPTGETIEGGSGFNDLIIYGNVDVRASNVNLRSFGGGNIIINSQLTLSADQVQDLANVNIIGRDAQSELVISGSGMADFTSVSDVRGMLQIMVESGVTLAVERAQLSMLRQAGDVVRFVGDGAIDFNADLSGGDLAELIKSEDLTITEMGEDLDGDERGGVAGSVAIDSSQGTRIGDSLTAALTDSDNPTITNYEWFRGAESIINGLSHDTYQLQDEDFENTIRVKITYNDDFGTGKVQEATLASAVRRDSAGSVAITAPQTRIGDTLTAALTDSDNPTVTNYEWFRGAESIISGLSHNTYQLQDADFGNSIRVVITYNDDFGNGKMIEATLAEAVRRDSAGSVAISTPQGTRIGDTLTAALTDSDNPTVTNYEWFRGAESIVSELSHSTYQLQNEDFGNSIRVEITYNDDFGNGKTQEATLTLAAQLGTIGSVSIDASQGTEVGDALSVGTFTDPDITGSPVITGYQWIRMISGRMEIAGTEATYTITTADVNAIISLQVTYDDSFGTQTATDVVQIPNAPELVGDEADEDLRALAALGDFTGDDPANEALPILLESMTGLGHANRVYRVYKEEALQDTAAHLFTSERNPSVPFESLEFGWRRDLEALNLPSDSHIIFTLANTTRADLDRLFDGYDDVIIFIGAGNGDEMNPFLEGNRSQTQEGFEKWAAAGRLYFVGGHAEVNETILHHKSAHASFTKDYYFLSPYNFNDLEGTSHAVQHTGAKVEAAFNVLNQTYGIDLVETVRILKGTASRFANPDDDIGLGAIDLRKLLVSDEEGNPLITDGKTTLKSLAELRMQAGLNITTGLPPAPLGMYADEDLRALAALGDFTGDDPANEAKPILLESMTGLEHANAVYRVYKEEALQDTAAHLFTSERSPSIPFESPEFGWRRDLEALNLPSGSHIIFTMATVGRVDLDRLFDGYDDVIIFISAGNDNQMNPFLGSSLSQSQAGVEKWAAAGRLYFIGGHAVGDEMTLHHESAHAGFTKDYYFLSPYNFNDVRGTSHAVQHTGAKVEAAFNVLNQTYGIDLVEVVRILKGTASSFDNPSDDIGLGVIDLRELLTADGNGLKSLADLRMQAGLNVTTGLPPAPLGMYADDDLRALAALGNFTGDDPANEAKPILLETMAGLEHANAVYRVYKEEALQDTAAHLFTSEASPGSPSEFPEFGWRRDLEALNLPSDSHIIFTLAYHTRIDLDRFFNDYDNVIIFINAGNSDRMNPFLEGSRSLTQTGFEKWAAEGRLYFVGGHAEGNETILHHESTHADFTKDYYFLSPYVYTGFSRGTSHAVQHTGAKVEAAFNVLNQTYGIDLVEVVRILKGTASSFDNPSDDIGLGVIDLRKLLTADGNGLKSLADLRMQANLDIATGLPIPPESPVTENGESAPLPIFYIDPPADEPPTPADNDFSTPDFSLPPNHYDDFI